jgi:CRP-like cAMP-binding protein
MDEGSYFGEMAIMSNKERSAAVVAKTNLHLAVMKAKDFNTIFKHMQNSLNFRLKALSTFFSDIN